MTDDRKRRIDAWDSSLKEEEQAAIFDRMRRHKWHEVAKWIAETYGIPAPSRASLYRFRETFADHESEYLIRQRIRDNEALQRELAQAGAPDPESLAKAFAGDVTVARAAGDEQAVERAIRAYKTCSSMVSKRREEDLELRASARADELLKQRERDLEIKLRRLELLERNSAEAKAQLASMVSGGGLSPETIAQIEEAAKLL
jgi:hypothetical protein